jgi:hypothetical protein
VKVILCEGEMSRETKILIPWKRHTEDILRTVRGEDTPEDSGHSGRGTGKRGPPGEQGNTLSLSVSNTLGS